MPRKEIPGIPLPPKERFTVDAQVVRRLPSEGERKVDDISPVERGSVPKVTAETLAHRFLPAGESLETSNQQAALRALIEESGVSGEVLESVFSQMTTDFRQALSKLVSEYLRTMRSVSGDKDKQYDAVRKAFVELVHKKLT